jgi:TolB-like protein/DNA-binding winged helix-turn-helix (wHTH) protein/Flp pilus assembly protein TadD
MKQSVSSPRVVRFGKFEADLRSGELRKQGLKVKLQEQPYQVLAALVERPGEVVTREELRKSLWAGDTFVDFDHSLNTAVMRLREALCDSSDRPRFIETLPRKGYRFIAPVEDVTETSPEKSHERPLATAASASASLPAATQAPPVPLEHAIEPARGKQIGLRRAIMLVGIAAVAVAAIGLTLRYFRNTDVTKAQPIHFRSVVVLPLENLSGEKDQEYFADGMTDELIASLAKIRSLRVISRLSAMEYKGTHKPLSEIARDLNVDAVVEGTVLRSGNRVRITAELVQVSTDHHIWAETYDSPLGDVLTLQNQVATAIANEIRIELTPEEQDQLTSVRPVSTEAYEDYLKGRYYYSNSRSNEGLTKAIEYYQQAIDKKPQYAQAYAGLANCYGVIGSAIVGTMPSLQAAPKARAAALRAIEIDRDSAEAQVALATVRLNYDWDWAGAAAGFQRAIELNPSYSTAYQRYSLYLMAMGRTEQSVAVINRAREIDPLSVSMNFSLGWRLYMSRQYDQAIERLQNTIEMDPNFAVAHLVLGQAYEQKGLYDQAVAELQKAVAISNHAPLMVAGLGHAYAVANKKLEAQNVLRQLSEQSKNQYVSPFYMALIHEGLGDTEKAMDWLDKAYQDRSNGLIFLKVDPELDSLRSNPRFKNLQQRLKLPD